MVERKRVIAVDFDGTLCEDGNYPLIGPPILKNIDYIKHLQNLGWETILWTCRGGEPLEQAVSWCKAQGLIFDAINEPTPNQHFDGPSSNKVFADIYLDDKAMLASNTSHSVATRLKNVISYSESQALKGIVKEIYKNDKSLPKGIFNAKEVAKEYEISRSLIVNVLKLMAAAGVIEARSLGSKGTYVEVLDEYTLKTLTSII